MILSLKKLFRNNKSWFTVFDQCSVVVVALKLK